MRYVTIGSSGVVLSFTDRLKRNLCGLVMVGIAKAVHARVAHERGS